MKILITGDKGFIGGNLSKRFIDLDDTVYQIDIDDFYSNNDQWTNELVSTLDDICPDVIFHVGACSDTLEQDVNHMMELNYESTKIITDWSKSNFKKLIYSSSAANYGSGNYPSNLYGWSKYAAEGYVISNGGLALRYFNVYGPGESHKGKMSSVAFQAYLKKQKGDIVKLFPGEPKRDFVYIEDVISANIFALENYEVLKYNWYDVGSESARTFEDVLVNMGILNWTYYSESDIPKGYQFYTKSSKWMPGWSPKYNIEKGLKEYIKVLSNE